MKAEEGQQGRRMVPDNGDLTMAVGLGKAGVPWPAAWDTQKGGQERGWGQIVKGLHYLLCRK